MITSLILVLLLRHRFSLISRLTPQTSGDRHNQLLVVPFYKTWGRVNTDEQTCHDQRIVFGYRVGEFAVRVLSDGSLDASFDLLDGIDQDEALSLLGAADPSPSPHMNINAFVIEAGARTILIDGGAGNLNGWGGRLFPALIAAGYDPLQIDTILLTHGHSDHVGGLAGPFATKSFRNVEKFFLHQAELNFWRNEERRDAAPVTHQRLFDVARNVLAAYQQQITVFEDGDVLLPGITAVHLPGHTPGHSGYLLESEDDSLLIWGDVLHFPHIQVARPDVTFAFDHNPGLAAKTRRKILTELSRNNRYVTGVHFNAPVRAKIERYKDAFRLTYDLYNPSIPVGISG